MFLSLANHSSVVPTMLRPVATDPRLTQTAVGAMAVPEIIFGGGTLSKAYNSNEFLQSEMPFRTLRLAMRSAHFFSSYKYTRSLYS